MLSLERKVAIRQSVRDWISIITVDQTTLDEQEYFKLALAEESAKVVGRKLSKSYEEQSESETMNFAQAKVFREVEIPFGIHKGTKVGELDSAYLRNLCSPNDFIKKLKRYVAYLDSIGGS